MLENGLVADGGMIKASYMSMCLITKSDRFSQTLPGEQNDSLLAHACFRGYDDGFWFLVFLFGQDDVGGFLIRSGVGQLSLQSPETLVTRLEVFREEITIKFDAFQ